MKPAHPRTSWFRPGRLLYRCWYQPLGWCERSWREGGPLEQWRTIRGRRAMAAAAQRLTPCAVTPPLPGSPAVFLLTGAAFWEQTAFCLRSLQQATPDVAWPVGVIDDGTLPETPRLALERAFPGLTVYSAPRTEAALDRTLPAGRFPTLRSHRLAYKHLRKLTDPHALHAGWNLVLDSDMLFFSRPDELVSWLRAPEAPLVMTDVANAYGYAPDVLVSLAGVAPPSRINVGITALDAARLDWSRIERWTYTLLREHGSSYFLEQALVALLLAGRPFLQLDGARYRVRPDEAEIARPDAILHHYVALSKRDYFRHAWRRFA
jgi:hypothetical protein